MLPKEPRRFFVCPLCNTCTIASVLPALYPTAKIIPETYIVVVGKHDTTIAQRLAIDTKHDGGYRRSLGSHPSCR